jgi:flagellar biogenesis protein FliO
MTRRPFTMTLAFTLACSCASGNPQDTFVGPMPIKSEPKPEPKVEPKPAPKPEPRPEVSEPTEPAPEITPAAASRPAAKSPAARREAAHHLAPEPKVETNAPSDAQSTPTPAPLTRPTQAAGTGGLGMARTVLSLAAVLALILLIAGVVKKWSAKVGGLAAAAGVGGKAPSGILSILGRYPLDRSTTLILLKAERRVLLLSQSRAQARFGFGASTLTTLCEFTADLEVAALVGKAEAAEGKTPSQRFQKALEDEGIDADEPVRPAKTPVKKQDPQEALAAVLREALKASKTVPAAKPGPAPASRTAAKPASGDAAADLRAKLAAMRAKSALGSAARRTEIAA